MKKTAANTGKIEKELCEPKQEEKNENQEGPLEESPLPCNHIITGLIDGLLDDVVLGEIVMRLSWYNLPVLKTLNKTWADALTQRFPAYASLHHRILSNSLVFYRIPSWKFPNSYHGLWVYNYARVLWRLPIPAIPENLQTCVKFVLDDNYDRIFSFTEIRENDGSLIYNVSMLDLSDGTMCRWTTLPSLQIRYSKYPIESVKYPYTCSSFKTGNRICIKLILRSWGPLIEAGSFAVWTLDGRNNSEWAHQWRCEPVTGPLIQSFSDAENNTPFYIEIEVKIPLRGGRTKSVKYLYHKCQQWKYTPEVRYSLLRNRNTSPEYIFMFKNDRRPMKDFDIYHIKVRESYTRSQLSFHKAKLDDESKRILHSSKWNVFEDFWRPVAPYSHHWENNGTSIIKIASNGYSGKKGINGIRWDKKGFKIGPGAHKIYDVRESINIKVAQKGHSLYMYKFVAKSEITE